MIKEQIYILLFKPPTSQVRGQKAERDKGKQHLPANSEGNAHQSAHAHTTRCTPTNRPVMHTVI